MPFPESMTPKDELIRFLASFWEAAIRDRSQTHAERKISDYFAALWQEKGRLVVSDELPVVEKRRRPRKEKVPGRGAFSPARRAVWFDRAGLGRWLGPNREPVDAVHMLEFYDDGEFAIAIDSFIGSEKEKLWWDAQLAGTSWTSIPPRSVVVHGNADGFFWFGARTRSEIDATIAAHPDAFPPRLVKLAQPDLAQLFRMLNGQQRALLVEQRVTSASSSPKALRLLICGTANLTPPLVQVVQALGIAVMNESTFTLAQGGRRKPPFITTDQAVGEAAAAAQTAKGKDPHDRIVTFVPESDDADRMRVVIGARQVIPDTRQDTKRFGIVLASDAVISIAGVRTRDLINVAWGIGKPVLPLAFTGGASREFWDRYRESIIARLRLSDDEVQVIEHGADVTEVARRCVAIIKRCCT